MGNFVTLGVITILMGFFLMFKGNRSRGQMSGEYGRAKGAFKGPIWFLLIVIGVFLIAIDPFIHF
jgi:vacuolar-type H+-ATPase subunit I/STV1